MSKRIDRDWSLALEKVQAEGCRICGAPAQAAHVTGRRNDLREPIRWAGANVTAWGKGRLLVHPDRIVPLCGPVPSSTSCHGRYDTGALDLMPHLTVDEQAQAVADLGGIEAARMRTCPSAYERRAA